MHDIVIVGAGTAGLSAAIYGARAGKRVLILEAVAYGGQIINSKEVENYPGIKHISGYDFASTLYEQALELGANIEYAKVTDIKIDGSIKHVITEKEDIPCKAVILATGAKNRPLGLEKEIQFIGSGISYCATCDGAFYKGKAVAVAGGGNTALEDAIFLTSYCEKVFLIHRRDSFRGESKLEEVLKKKTNIEFILDSHITELLGEKRLEGLKIQNKTTKEETTLQIDGLFIAIGQMPENTAFKELVTLDKNGYIIALEDCKTNQEGIFVAGDCRTKQIRQLTTAASDGAVAAVAACEMIDRMDG